MSQGYTGTILRVDLSNATIERQQPGDAFYRMYMGGSAVGTYFLLKETGADTQALSPENIVTIAPGLTTGAMISGVSRCCVTALSPATGAVGDSQAGGKIGPMIKRAGYDAIVITGKAQSPCYLLVDGDDVCIKDATALSEKTVLEVHDSLTEELGSKNISILQCGPAGEKQVCFACLMADLNDAFGRTGMGAVFGSKNLRAVVVKSSKQVEFADKEGLRKLTRLGAERVKDADFPATLKQYGTPGVVGFQAQAGNLATRNYAASFHPDYLKLDGQSFEPDIGSRHTTCPGCAVGCRKTVKAEAPHKVTDRLGGPEFETLGLLGSNLDITDPVAVAKANELCNNYGIDTITMGGLAAYVFECMDKGLITPEQMQGKQLGFGDVPGLLWLIEQVVSRKGVGDILAQGFTAAIEHFGAETAAYAIHVKNSGLAVHMAQVKPSQSLMYAACPIGPDHMSCEHDWLLASDSDACKALGIIGRGKADATDLAKVRMTVYSQQFYSLLDTLCLCMFCWGPGNLYNYRDLEDLLRFTTGWDCSLWELMKVGQRRINMMRQLNARRGFTRDDDKLPERLTQPLPEGPAQGRHVDAEGFPHMLNQYYTLMGWDTQTGNPTEAVLLELGLEWII
jgi:aldehyde:ferredoxin oxidoreductase